VAQQCLHGADIEILIVIIIVIVILFPGNEYKLLRS